MDSDAEQARQVRREIAELREQVHALRLLALRVSAVVAVALVAVGSVLPAWVEEREDESHTYRVLTVGFQPISDPGGGFGVAVRTGFIVLLAVLLLLCLVLMNSVAARAGHERYGPVRGLIGTLAIVGSVVATLFSLLAWGADASDGSGGWGPLVLLAGVIIGVVVIHHRPWHDLWLDRASARSDEQGPRIRSQATWLP